MTGTLRSHNWPIEQLPGLSAEHQHLLQEHGIQTTLDLLACAQTPQQRQAIATQLRLHPKYLNTWAALADLSRIPLVGCQHCGLLLHAGIASVVQLEITPLHRLHRQMLKFQVATTQSRDLCPSLETVAHWVQQANALEPIQNISP